MPEFTPKLSVTDTSILEQKSIDCLEVILYHSDIKTHFTINDKTANTDGKIELMTDRRIFGNITVQIKTYPTKYYGQSKFDFPTSIFGYAKNCPIEVVFLIAVDSQENIAYWKHIDKPLISKQQEKSNQETITIHFDQDEIVNKENIDSTVKRWKELYQQRCNLILRNEEINKKNEQLTNQLEKFQDPSFSISKDDVIRIQKFIDTYNHLLDYEYQSIKSLYFSNAWKMGIAVFEYEDDKLSYVIHEIRYGENSLLIKEIPAERIKDYINYTLVYRSCIKNAIKENPENYAFTLIQMKIKDIIENKKIIFLTEETAIEFIFDFIAQNTNSIKIKKEESYELISLKTSLEEKFPLIGTRISYISINNNKNVNVNNIYDCIQFLVNGGNTTIKRLYPGKGHYGNTGFVSDFYSSDLAFEKVRIIYKIIPSLFDAFMITVFPSLRDKITFFDGYDLILVNLIYQDGEPNNYYQNHQIVLYYLELSNKSNIVPDLIVSYNFDSDLFRANNISKESSINELFDLGKMIIYHGKKYKLRRLEGADINILYDNYCIHNLLYHYLKRRFKDYLNPTHL